MAVTGWHEVGKGTRQRPADQKALEENWKRIFGEPKQEKKD